MDKSKMADARAKGRAESKAKKILEIRGWSIYKDERQFTNKKDNRYYYFSTLELALRDIANDEVSAKIKDGINLESICDTLKNVYSSFNEELQTILADSKAVSRA